MKGALVGLPLVGAQYLRTGRPPQRSNPYAALSPYRFLDDLNPVAPKDRLDSPDQGMWAPLPPGQTSSFWNPIKHDDLVWEHLTPDFIPPYNHLKNFPQKSPATLGAPPPAPDLRSRVEMNRQFWLETDPNVLYPAQPQEDRLDVLHPVAREDGLPERYQKYFAQSFQREQTRQARQMLNSDFGSVDLSSDKAVQWDEFYDFMVNKLRKSEEHTSELWKRYIRPNANAMTAAEYRQAAEDGFDIKTSLGEGEVELETANGLALGYWGEVAKCGLGEVVVSARLKLQPFKDDPKTDNSGMNGVEFKCANVKTGAEKEELKSNEADEGEWTKWASCPKGQFMTGFQALGNPYSYIEDNLSLSSFAFECVDPPQKNAVKILFSTYAPDPEPGESKVDLVKTEAVKGQWGVVQRCQAHSAFCGFKTRVRSKAKNVDNMGVTSVAILCCPRLPASSDVPKEEAEKK